MNRFLIVFRSHHEEPADIHVVDAWASSSLAAIHKAIRNKPPLHDWVLVRAYNWPKTLRGGVVEAAEQLAKIKVG